MSDHVTILFIQNKTVLSDQGLVVRKPINALLKVNRGFHLAH